MTDQYIQLAIALCLCAIPVLIVIAAVVQTVCRMIAIGSESDFVYEPNAELDCGHVGSIDVMVHEGRVLTDRYFESDEVIDFGPLEEMEDRIYYYLEN